MNSFVFPKTERILKQWDFVNLNRWGKRRPTRHFIITFKRNGLGFTRLGVRVSKRIGNAVMRNKIKRLVRECFRLNKTYFPEGYDILITARKCPKILGLSEISQELCATVTHIEEFS